MHGQDSNPAPTPGQLNGQLQNLQRQVQSVADENSRLSDKIRQLEFELIQQRMDNAPGVVTLDETAAADPRALLDPDPVCGRSVGPPAPPPGLFRTSYDRGFIIAGTSPDDVPFSLKINSQTMFRYSEFNRDEPSWVDSAGNINPINSNNNFQIPRGRLILSGNVLVPDLSYLVNIDYNSVTSNPIGFRAYELNYSFSRAFTLGVGQGKVPGSREWLESAFAALEGPDRSMATTFFRPSLSQGIWFKGEPLEGLFYHAMMSNGFNTLNVRPDQLDGRYCWSGSTWWEPWGAFGRGYADLEMHERPAIRLGSSYTFALGHGSQTDGSAVENSLVRLSDGTLITQTGAFAPGVTLTSYDISLAAVDLALKCRGFSISTEMYAQTLSGLKADGPLPVDSTQAYGGLLQGGMFVRPGSVEIYSRGSFVTGKYGSGTESACGFNWFIIPGESNLRFTFDTAWLESSPASQSRTGFVAGQTGLLLRAQIAATF